MRHIIPFAGVLFAPAAFASGHAGAYMVSPAADAAACARVCAEDGLCISWTFADQSCALAAVVMTPAEGVSFGLSARAPAQFQLRSIPSLETPAGAGGVDAAAKPDAIDPAPDLLGGPVEVPLHPVGKG